MKHFIYLTLTSLLLFVTSCKDSDTSRAEEDFNFGWRFTLGDNDTYASAYYDDSNWRELHLPHDWSVEGEFSADNPSTPA